MNDAAPTQFRLLKTGAEGLATMLAAIRSAQATVCLETYIYCDDDVGLRFLEALTAAAGRGVAVRVLVDALGSIALSDRFWNPLRAAGGRIRWFNPMSLRRWTYRDHRKLLVCDGRIAIVGGFNIAADYDGDGVKTGWRDSGLWMEGPPAQALVETFDRMFGLADFRHRRLQRLRKARDRIAASSRWSLLSSGPGCRHGEIRRTLARDLARARDVRIATAYFLPTRRVRRELRRVVKRGGRVQLMLAGRSDVLLAQLASRWLYGALRRSGIEIAEYLPRMFHSKVIVMDDTVYVGSANLDTRSLSINYELLVRVQDAWLATAAAAEFDADLDRCRRIKRRGRRHPRSWWDRLRESWAYFLLAKLDVVLARWQRKTLR